MTATPSSPDHAGGHPPVDELADLAEGLIDSPAAVEALHRHLADCAECRETVDALAEVQELLGTVETPPMPADVAARLDAALARAAAEAGDEATDVPGAADAPDAAPGARHAAVAGPQEPSPGRRPGTPAPPARAASGRSAPSSRPAAPTGPGRPRPRRRFALLLGAAAALAAVGIGGAVLLHPDDRAGGTAVSAGAPADTTAAAAQNGRTPHAASAGTVYRADVLATQIQQLLARSGNAATAPGPQPTGQAEPQSVLPAEGARPELSSPAPSSSASPAPSPGCPAPAPGAPVATDRGSFDGAPVDVLVYPVPGRPDLVDVYLRAPDCGRIVLHQSVPSR
ncbi:hypothetical protein [Kitasatospora sp. NPDC085464]|uniref:hypothetical protein n=1 Tax=Kitasatospora sp. NPDC085464 TaxID=3364063 RepID=UPI0037C4FC53